MSRTKYKRRPNRSTQIITTVLSILIVSSVILSLVGSFFLQDSSRPTPTPTYVYPTFTPVSSPTPVPTAGVPALEMTPTASP